MKKIFTHSRPSFIADICGGFPVEMCITIVSVKKVLPSRSISIFNPFSQGQTLFDLSTGHICVSFSIIGPFLHLLIMLQTLMFSDLFCQQSCCPLTLRC
jgi:hypothetical protein